MPNVQSTNTIQCASDIKKLRINEHKHNDTLSHYCSINFQLRFPFSISFLTECNERNINRNGITQSNE